MDGKPKLKRYMALMTVIALGVSVLCGCTPADTHVADATAANAVAEADAAAEQSFAESYPGENEVEEYVSAVKLLIISGVLYVEVYDGTLYKTTVEADEISVVRPEPGRGTVSTAEIRKDHRTVMYFSRSYVQESNMTQAEVEEEFGPVTVAG